MDFLAHLRRLHAFDDWANREVLSALRGVEGPPPKAVKLFAHILAAKRIWLDRLIRGESSAARLPDSSLEECGRQFEALLDDWRGHLDGLTPEALARVVSYRDTEGRPWEHTVADILTHLPLHSHYHRGQIAAELGAGGRTPPATDFIAAVRLGLGG